MWLPPKTPREDIRSCYEGRTKVPGGDMVDPATWVVSRVWSRTSSMAKRAWSVTLTGHCI
jgi:hypothetical protein